MYRREKEIFYQIIYTGKCHSKTVPLSGLWLNNTVKGDFFPTYKTKLSKKGNHHRI